MNQLAKGDQAEATRGQELRSAIAQAPESTEVVGVSAEQDGIIDGELRTADLQESSLSSAGLIHEEDVAVRVNGRAIFVSEVMEPYRGFFAQQGAGMSEAELSQARRQIIEKDLDQYIEQAVILDAARAGFKQDQWDELQTKLDEIFYDEEIANLQKKLKVSSSREVEQKLQEMGSSMAAYRRVWGERQVAGQWVSEKIPDVSVSRQELLDEYESKRESYREPEQVKWQQCWISIDKSGGREGAQQRVQQVIGDLKGGITFDDVIREHSDGAESADGGLRDWTRTDSLAEESLRDTLTKLKLNQLGPVLEDERGFRLVKLLGYRPERVTPFEEVQPELREAISQRKRSAAAQEIIDDLKAKAHIESVIDPPQQQAL